MDQFIKVSGTNQDWGQILNYNRITLIVVKRVGNLVHNEIGIFKET